MTDLTNQSEIGWGETCSYLFYVILQWYDVTILWYSIWFMAPVSLYQVNPCAKRFLDTWLGFRCKLIPQICVVHPNEQYLHGCDSLIGVLFWCILHFELYCTIDLSRAKAQNVLSKKLFNAALNRRKYLLSLSLSVFYIYVMLAGFVPRLSVLWTPSVHCTMHPANEATPSLHWLTELEWHCPATKQQARPVGHGTIAIERGVISWAGERDPAPAACRISPIKHCQVAQTTKHIHHCRWWQFPKYIYFISPKHDAVKILFCLDIGIYGHIHINDIYFIGICTLNLLIFLRIVLWEHFS